MKAIVKITLTQVYEINPVRYPGINKDDFEKMVSADQEHIENNLLHHIEMYQDEFKQEVEVKLAKQN